MAIKAVFFDIDGTLLNDSKRVEKATALAIKQLKEQGILVGVATGRGPGFVQPFMDNLGLDVAVTYNGQYIFTRDKILYQNQLPKPLLYRVIRYAGDKKREISLGTASGLVGSGLIEMGTSNFGQMISRLVPKKLTKTVENTFKKIIRRIKPQNMDYLKTLMREPVFQVVLIATAGEGQKLRDKFPQITITRSSPYSIDLISQGQSKLKGIERIGEVFEFDLDEVMAFGDSDNDMEMLTGVGIGVAMGNGHDKLKSIADYTTDSNNRDGISKALAHHGLIHLEPDQGFKSRDDNFNKVKTYHSTRDGSLNHTPRLYDIGEGGNHAQSKIEDIVAFLYAASQGDHHQFTQSLLDLHAAIDQAAQQVGSRSHPETPLVGEVAALTDLLYHTYGSFVLMGVDPKPLFDVVHESSMRQVPLKAKTGNDTQNPRTNPWQKSDTATPAIKKELDRQIHKSLQRKP